jgi:lipopolysaccharide/colanic/teichoic acid biosynthesis glycosyltransferase
MIKGYLTMANGMQRVAKRVFDIVASAAMLVVSFPLLIGGVFASAIAHGGNPFFVSCRAGRNGWPIRVLKIKTMSDRPGPDGWPLPDAERLTKTGRFLRASSIDELPQLINILLGQMSFVGPRPLPLSYIDRYSADERRRLVVRPGLTGLAQVMGRNTVAWGNRLAADVEYVETWTLALDVQILWQTVGIVVRRQGVSSDGHVTMPEFMGSDDAVLSGSQHQLAS